MGLLVVTFVPDSDPAGRRENPAFGVQSELANQK